MPDPEELLIKLLAFNKRTIWAGIGKEGAKLVREICASMEFDEDLYLHSHMLGDKEKWMS